MRGPWHDGYRGRLASGRSEFDSTSKWEVENGKRVPTLKQVDGKILNCLNMVKTESMDPKQGKRIKLKQNKKC